MQNKRQQRTVLAWTWIVLMVVVLQGVILLPQMRAQSTEAVIYLDSLRQVVSGFGAANIVPWRPDMTSDQAQKAFGTGPGQLGFSILRLRVPYSTSEFALNVPTAQTAYSMAVKIIASPWTPPAWMKTSNNIVGGSLYDTSYASYAAHLKSFVDYMSSNGVSLYAVSVQNEPDAVVTYESCSWNATQFLNFMKNNAQTVGVPIFMPESENFNHQLSDSTLSDPVAASHVAFIGGHIYGGGLTSYPLAASTGKELWMTEHLDTDTSWAQVLKTGKEILDCTNAGMNAYVWWYIVRYYGPIGEDGSVTKRGYVMSQYSRFIRPNYVRVYTTIARGSVYITAYSANGSNSKFVIVAVNMGSSSTQQTFKIENIAIGTATVKPFVTSRTKNCEQQSDIAVSNGTFAATLADSSVTTFVGDVVVGVDNVPEVPQAFELRQNYPNPFNPSTVIRYDIPKSVRVKLNVYDILGREVVTLVNQDQNPGYYGVTFHARNLPSGLYFYNLRAGGQNIVKKMLLLK